MFRVSEVSVVDSDWCVIAIIISTQHVSKPNFMEQAYSHSQPQETDDGINKDVWQLVQTLLVRDANRMCAVCQYKLWKEVRFTLHLFWKFHAIFIFIYLYS